MTQTRGVQEKAYAEAVKTAQVRPEDGATVALGRRLAQLIDQERGELHESLLVVKLAGEYRQVLAQLGMTPAARGAKAKPGGGATVHELPINPLEASRDAARQRRAAAVNAPSA